MSGGCKVAASPGLGANRPSAAVLWLGPAVVVGDASIGAGLVWFAVLVGAVGAGAVTFGLVMTAIATLGAWQAATVRSRDARTHPSQGAEVRTATVKLHPSHRLPAAALAGAVGFAGVLDTRLVGAVLGAAVLASFIVVGALGSVRDSTVAARRDQPPTRAVLARAGLLIRTWMHVGVAAACSAAIARYSLGAALVLVIAAAAYDAGVHVSAAGRPPGLRGPLVGAFAAVVAIFALTGLSVPPFEPADVIRFGVLAALTFPLGAAAARPVTAFGMRPRQRPNDGPKAVRRSSVGEGGSQSPRWQERAWRRLSGEWAVRRIDSLSVAALAWMWGLGLLAS